jgi:3'-phosphoadenosine 5'-phosphosulfate (PAPS) 3'-phosphatase
MSQEQLNGRVPKYQEPFDPSQDLADDYSINVAASLNNMNQQMMDFINQLAPYELSRLGGAGNKVNRVALGECDCYIQPRSGLGFWDMCAPEVIIRAMGGLMTTLDKDRLCYDINRGQVQ